MKITIPDYRAKSRNMTAKKHWTAYANARNEIFEFMRAYCPKVKVIEPAHITIEAYYKGKRAIDTSNIDDKLMVDGLMLLGILTDDTPDKNPIVTKMSFPESGEDKVVITIEKIKNTN